MERRICEAVMDGISMEHTIKDGSYEMKAGHFHPEYEIYYMVSGARRFFFNNRSFIAMAGDLVLVDSNLLHMTKAPDESGEDYNRIILYVSREKMEEMDRTYPSLKLPRLFKTRCGIYHLSDRQKKEFMKLYHTFRWECREKEYGYKIAVELSFVRYMLEFARDDKAAEKALGEKGEEKDGKEDKFEQVAKIANFLQENMERTYSLDELSEKFFLSKYHICRLFKEATGVTVSEYVNIQRVRKARHYLEETKLSISEIAGLLGYGSMTHFEKIFKRYMHATPLEYRKNQNRFAPIHHEE